MLSPHVNIVYKNAHLRFVSEAVANNTHVVLVLDQAGWHVAHALEGPKNLTLLHLQPYPPQLDGVEILWAWATSRYLSDRVYLNYENHCEAATTNWNGRPAARLRSLTTTLWLTPVTGSRGKSIR